MNTTQRNKLFSLFIIIISLVVIFIEILDGNYFILLLIPFTVIWVFLFFSNEDENEKRKYKKIIEEKVISLKLDDNEKIEYFFIAEYRCPNAYAAEPLIILDLLHKLNLCYIFLTNKGIHLQEVSRGKADNFYKYIFYSYDSVLSLNFIGDFPFGKILKIIFKNEQKIFLNIRKNGQFGFLDDNANNFLLKRITIN